MPEAPPIDDRARVLELVSRYGACATAFQTLEPGYRYFWAAGGNACVAYVDTGSAWVAAGEPIAAPGDAADAASAFLSAAGSAGRRACFFGTERPLVATQREPLRALSIGEQPVWDPRTWAQSLAGHRSLREQLRRARAKGVRVRELTPAELGAPELRERVTRLTERWHAAHGLAPMGFLVQVEPFEFAAQRRAFVAERAGEVVGFASAVPVPARGGWFLEDLLRDPGAPNGTGELLVHALMQWASDAHCTWLTLGLAPLAGSVPRLLRWARACSKPLYDFGGLRAYKAKFRPHSWQPAYLCYPRTQSSWLTVVDTLTAFARGSLFRFALSTLSRSAGSSRVRAYAALLTPWALLGPVWAAIAAAGYASRAACAAAINSAISSFTPRSRSAPRAIGS